MSKVFVILGFFFDVVTSINWLAIFGVFLALLASFEVDRGAYGMATFVGLLAIGAFIHSK